MVNLIGADRPSRARESLDALLTHAQRALLDERRREARSWWRRRSTALHPIARRARTPSLQPDVEDDAGLAALEAALLELSERRARSLAATSTATATPPATVLLTAAHAADDGISPDPSRDPAVDPPTGSLAGIAVDPDAGAGCLLVCEIDMSIGGGEAEVASQGLFDADDRPPWDLWLVAFGRTRRARPDEPIRCVVAWLPEEWEGLARAGIDACPTGGLYLVD